jgi:hypothetical protein
MLIHDPLISFMPCGRREAKHLKTYFCVITERNEISPFIMLRFR